MTAGQKAAHTRKWRKASLLAYKCAKNAKTFTKYKLGKKGFKCLSLDSKRGYEYKGVVDLIAVKRNKQDPDKLNIVLVQVKGGSARVSSEEISRIKKAVKKVNISWIVAEKPRKTVKFSRLG